MKSYIEKVLRQEDLTIEEMEAASHLLFSDTTDERQKASFLTALRAKRESVSELTGLAKVMKAVAVQLPKALPDVMDNCGTGGDGSHSFNISTTSAFVLAGAGMTVAKHGNRSISSQTGSADVLEELGVHLSATPEDMMELLEQNNIAFLFAQSVHPAMKHVMPVRKAMGIPTIFNLIGPLTNPAFLTTQLMGVYREEVLMDIGRVLQNLGRKRAVVVHGNGGLDEASLAGMNKCVLVTENKLSAFDLCPEEVGLRRAENTELKGGNAKENARILRSVLGGMKGPHRDVVVLNAGLGLLANGKASTPQEGVQLAEESIDSGAALEKLDYLVAYGKGRR
ncbi:MAG: anthranilate phosphoribosyltransferase [Alkalibacterium sp.]|nr:anthranilate phosphoribosyltransferase [Alkalibacterium sp.]